MEKISKQIISDQQIIQQCAPKIIQTILLNQLKQIMSQEPKDQKIIQKPKRRKNNRPNGITNAIKYYKTPKYLFGQPCTTLLA